jgi:hypothetical protein
VRRRVLRELRKKQAGALQRLHRRFLLVASPRRFCSDRVADALS